MVKRPRSEDNDGSSYAGLAKNHISDREVNSGVQQEVRMRSVYEKTLALLYRGSRNAANNNTSAQVNYLWIRSLSTGKSSPMRKT